MARLNDRSEQATEPEPADAPVRVEPWDEPNRSLVAHVHPPGWRNPSPPERYDMVVVGAGTAGLVTAAASAGLGKRVALVERHLMGGDCLNVGCVPSKALLRSARAAADVRNANSFGVPVEGQPDVDFAGVMARMRALRAGIAPDDGADRFAHLGVDVYLGTGRFTGPATLDVGGTSLHFRKACIATGTRAAAPPIPGLEEVGYLTNESVFTLTERPGKLAVIGAGPIGCELAQALARFGAEVLLVESTHGVLPREDADCSAIVRDALARDGVRLLCCGKQTHVERVESGKRLTLQSHGAAHDEVVDEILVAAGRAPNVDGLGLDEAGVAHDKRGVRVDDTLRTTNPRIFAAGDICMPYKFTHAADATARIVMQNALLPFLPFRAKASRLTMPWCTYTDPEIAHVGKHAYELDREGTPYETIRVPMSGVDRAPLEGDDDGTLHVHVRRRSGRILGATLVSRHAGETIGELTTAMAHGIPLHRMARVIHPYPTQSEAIKQAADRYLRQRLTAMKEAVGRLLPPWGSKRT